MTSFRPLSNRSDFFLVNGSTVGNLAMVLSVCKQGDAVLVQRNSHKSIFNALELAGARPIFISPKFDQRTERYSYIDSNDIKQAIEGYSEIKALVLTHPDYFGTTYDLSSIVDIAHKNSISVLVDEAHGAHFPLSDQFPKSALEAGADIVVHSAHKSLPAMTMGSFLHIQSSKVSHETVKNYLQMLQSSSPSYPIMASLDLARQFVSQLTETNVSTIIKNINELRIKINELPYLRTKKVENRMDDPLKVIVSSNEYNLHHFEGILNHHHIFPEMVENNQMLFMAGLDLNPIQLDWIDQIKNRENNIRKLDKRDTITLEQATIKSLDYSYNELKSFKAKWVDWERAAGEIAAQAVIPYPPGVPLLLKGERINQYHIAAIKQAFSRGQYIQYSGKDLSKGIEILLK
nr:aminotransferase class I/II-fold pyridoxal phosphate-dependent enzyme [Piscibacillus salipiscarius]